MQLKPYIRFAEDVDGNRRWSTIIEDVATSQPVCHLVAITADEAIHNAQQLYRLIKHEIEPKVSPWVVYDWSQWDSDLQ